MPGASPDIFNLGFWFLGFGFLCFWRLGFGLFLQNFFHIFGFAFHGAVAVISAFLAGMMR